MTTALVVFVKELKDELRDRRTWLIVLVSSLVAGPVSLLLIASIVSSAEESAARREVVLANAHAARALVNFLQRSGATVRDAPADYREQLRSGLLQNAVVVVPDDFGRRIAAGESIRLEVVHDEASLPPTPYGISMPSALCSSHRCFKTTVRPWPGFSCSARSPYESGEM